MVLPWLGPTVAGSSYLVRAAAYTGALMLHQTLCMFAVWGICAGLERIGLCRKNTKEPTENWWYMFAVSVEGFFFYFFAAGMVLAYFNPTPGFWSFDFSFSRTFWYQVPIMLAHDTLFFFAHMIAHRNKWLYNKVHAFHHQHKAILNVLTCAYDTWGDAVATTCPALALIAWAACMMGNYWALFVPLHVNATVFMVGHCGYEITSDNLGGFAMMLLCPWTAVLATMPSNQAAMEHEKHHLDPRYNFAVFFTHWDEWYGSSSRPETARTTLLLNIVTTLGFYVPFVFYAEWVLWHGPRVWFALVLLNLATPLPRLFLYLLGGRIAHLITRLSIWDRIRKDFHISYAAADEAGAFKPDSTKRYIFCYQPMGVQARGAWYTFAGKGKESPVKDLDVKLAVSREVWALPISQPIHCLYDCCDSSYKTLKRQLSKARPSSVCITVGGFKEAKYLGTYNVATRVRRGFARLAVETGAALVPTIGIGEPFVGDEPAMNYINLIVKTVICYRPHPIKVVFGEPITPKAGETADALHARYCEGLMRLAKQHDVPLKIVE